MKIVILAGGSGTRLWPVSRATKPKQIQPFIGDQTLLQKTYRRQRLGFKNADILVSTNKKSKAAIKKQLPALKDNQFILEPAKRDTAAAIGLAAVTIAQKDPTAIMMTVGSDHYIRDEKEYIRVLKLAEQTIHNDPRQSLLVGIRPTYPETGYGYIKINKLYKQVGNYELFFGQRFVEKPDLKTAKKYLRNWDYLWNTNMFCWRVDYLLELFKKFLPAHHRRLMRIQKALGTSSERTAVEQEFSRMKPVSIDVGIMERTRKIIVIPADYGWSDVGHWRAVKDILSTKAKDNVVRGKHVSLDSEDNLIYSYTGKLVSTIGITETIVIETDDCLLIASKDRAQDVKKMVEQLKKKRLKRYL